MHGPCGPKEVLYGYEPTCWREWPAMGPACEPAITLEQPVVEGPILQELPAGTPTQAPSVTPKAVPNVAPNVVTPPQNTEAAPVEPNTPPSENPLPTPPNSSSPPNIPLQQDSKPEDESPKLNISWPASESVRALFQSQNDNAPNRSNPPAPTKPVKKPISLTGAERSVQQPVQSKVAPQTASQVAPTLPSIETQPAPNSARVTASAPKQIMTVPENRGATSAGVFSYEMLSEWEEDEAFLIEPDYPDREAALHSPDSSLDDWPGAPLLEDRIPEPELARRKAAASPVQ